MSPVHLYPINVNNLHCCAIRAKGCLYGGGSVLLVGRANHCCRDRASQLNSLLKFVFVYMRGGPAVLGGISLLTNEISPNRGGNFPFSSQERWKYSIFLQGALEIFHYSFLFSPILFLKPELIIGLIILEFQGAKIWNSLNENIKLLSVSQFKKK